MRRSDRSATPTVHPLLPEAVGLHQAGRTAEAAELYKKIIAQVPTDFDAAHLLGVIALQEGHLAEAEQLITAAMKLKPGDGVAHNNLGTVYLRDRRFDLAYRQFQTAVEMQPNFAAALTNLGTVLRQLGRPREALIPLRRAHAADPNSALVCNLLGACHLDTGEALAAVAAFESATAADPDDATGWSNLAIALSNSGNHDRARECADKAVASGPRSSTAIAALAAIEFEQGRFDSALAKYQEAIALPEPSAQTYCAFANALWTCGRCEEAFEQLECAVALDGNNVLALWKLAMSQCQPIYASVAEIEASRRRFAASLGGLRSWFHAAPRPEAHLAVGTAQPFYLAYQPAGNRELLAEYGALCGEWMAAMPDARAETKKPRRTVDADPVNRKLRVGIVSAQIRDHSVWNAITKGWVGGLNQELFEISLFHLGNEADAETARAKLQVAHFEDQPRDLRGWIRAVSEARPDVLIYPEIGMHTLTTQLASLRLAPIQAASWGHPETTGLPTIDLYLSAEALEPAAAQDNYTEKLVRLPHLGVYVETLQPAIVAPDLQSLGLPHDQPLLLCPGAPFKYSPAHDRVWARIAKGLSARGGRRGWHGLTDRVRGRGYGRLVFFRSGNTFIDGILERRLRAAFAAEDLSFEAHVCWVPYLDRGRFFGLMQQSTLMLDTLGFSGFNTTLQAIEAGLPVLSYEGEFMRGRLASGVIGRLDLPQLITRTTDEFIEAAIRLALDDSESRNLRSEIAQRRSVLFHDTQPIRALERCLIEAAGRT